MALEIELARCHLHEFLFAEMAKSRGPHLIQGHPIQHSGTAALGHAVN